MTIDLPAARRIAADAQANLDYEAGGPLSTTPPPAKPTYADVVAHLRVLADEVERVNAVSQAIQDDRDEEIRRRWAAEAALATAQGEIERLRFIVEAVRVARDSAAIADAEALADTVFKREAGAHLAPPEPR